MVREILEDTHEEDEEGVGIDEQAQSKCNWSPSKRFRALGVEDEEEGGEGNSALRTGTVLQEMTSYLTLHNASQLTRQREREKR